MANTGIPVQAVVCEYDGFSGRVQVQLELDGPVRYVAFETRPFFGNRIPQWTERMTLQLDNLFQPRPTVLTARFS